MKYSEGLSSPDLGVMWLVGTRWVWLELELRLYIKKTLKLQIQALRKTEMQPYPGCLYGPDSVAAL